MDDNLNAKEDNGKLRPLCFMVMPYGKKPTNSDKGPATIDYDALWDKALFPMIEEDLCYNAVRADQDLGAMIIKEMIERLALADMVIADVTTANANVYYEIGVRHAAKKTGCVLISADWSKQLFDIEQMRQVRYPLPEGAITDETSAAVRQKLSTAIAPLTEGISPVFDCIPGFPGNIDISRCNAFRKQIEDLSQFTAEIRTIRLMPKEQQPPLILQLINRYRRVITSLPSVALEIIYLLRDTANWQQALEFIDSLTGSIKNIPLVKEQRALAQSKTGDHFAAIAALEELIKLGGETSERRGLIGGRYKKLYYQTKETRYLDSAIDEYDKGMRLDLNDYYCSSNLPRLLRTRNEFDDEEKAKAVATVVLMACERKRAMDPTDQWLLPTLLGAAFEDGNVSTAQKLYREMKSSGVAAFHLDTTIADLELSVSLTKDENVKTQLTAVLESMRKLL